MLSLSGPVFDPPQDSSALTTAEPECAETAHLADARFRLAGRQPSRERFGDIPVRVDVSV